MRVAVGAVAKRILEEIGVEVASHIVNFGGESRLQFPRI